MPPIPMPMSTLMTIAQISGGNPFGGFSGEQLIVWLAIAWAVMMMVEKGTALVGRLRGRLPMGESPEHPVYHRTSDRPVNWAELGALQRRVEIIEANMQKSHDDFVAEVAALRQEAEKRATRIMSAVGQSNGDIHTKINGVAEAVAYIKGKMDQADKAAAAAAKTTGKS